jgi:TonB-dependent receptor
MQKKPRVPTGRIPTPQSLIALAVASLCSAGHAQQAPAADPVQTITVTGIRAALESSLKLKRNSDGIVDGISADDIGKFPDTNLAESLQRISGVSIDRNNGEGSRVTVRGVGPDFNLVLLNGRQMPSSAVGDNRNSRSFDFANLASDSISQIQVYKSARADTPVGGIGATLNVITSRPFDAPGLRASFGIKGVFDKSANNLPDVDKPGGALTPEVTGLYSNTFADNTFGVLVSGSYQKRNSGEMKAFNPNGWRGPFTGSDTSSWGALPTNTNIINRPTGTTLYSAPQNFAYAAQGVSRERVNGQVVLQYKPVEGVVTTLDYTYSENKIHTKRSEVGAWFNFGNQLAKYDGATPIASPLYYGEDVVANDIAYVGSDAATKTKNQSVGFNATWKLSPKLKFALDVHSSSATTGADSPWGSGNNMNAASFSRGKTVVDYSNQNFPVLMIAGADFTAAPLQATGSWFQDGYQRMEINQAQASGQYKLEDSSRLNFGLSATDVKNRTTFSQVQNDTWGGATKPSDYSPSLFQTSSINQYFSRLSGSNDPRLFNTWKTFDFGAFRQRVSDATGKPSQYLPAFGNPTQDQRTTEASQSGYAQWAKEWDLPLPVHTAIGMRYESTKVTSTALVPSATDVVWVSQNELPITFGAPIFTTKTGKYSNWLPSFDADVELRPDLKLRASYGETIGRASYDQLQSGLTLGTTATVAGTTGQVGNPGLLPVKSRATDLSLEFYYARNSYMSAGIFDKRLSNYSGTAVVTDTPYNLHTPVGGKYWNAALASGCAKSDTACIRNFIFANFNGQPGVKSGTITPLGNNGTITGQPTDPLMTAQITTYANTNTAGLNGIELNLQHMFGNTGFGVIANYTKVTSGLKYDNNSTADQFALVGMSDSANLTGIYENATWSARVAYNWRDKFLASTVDATGSPGPQYVAAYGQIDFSVNYKVTPQLSVQLEGINIGDSIKRVYSRTEAMTQSVNVTSPRYMIGARYKF